MRASRLIVVTFVLGACFQAMADVPASFGPTFPGSEPAQRLETPPGPGLNIDFAIFTSARNGYSRGMLDWWFERSFGKRVDSGSAGFLSAELTFLFPAKASSFRSGLGLGFYSGTEGGLWGGDWLNGAGEQLVLEPRILSLSVPFKVRVTERFPLYAGLEPSFQVGWVTGYLHQGTQRTHEFIRSPGAGGQVAASAEYFPFPAIGFALKGGMRFLQVPLAYSDVTASTGYTQPLLDNAPVKVDLSGSFVSVGFILRI